MTLPVGGPRGAWPEVAPVVRSLAARRVLALVSGYPRERRARQPIVVLQANIDDSGKGNRPVFVLAGFVATAERWAGFADEWQACLDVSPRLGSFKMNHAVNRTVQFRVARFPSQEMRDERLRAFVEIIDRHLPFGVACVVRSEDYEAVFRGRGSQQMNSPYFLAFYGIMQQVMRVQAIIGSPHPANFIFDEQGKEVGRALRHWERFKAAVPATLAHLVGNRPDSRKDHEWLPLQAADMLALGKTVCPPPRPGWLVLRCTW